MSRGRSSGGEQCFVFKSTGAYDPVAQAAADAMRGAGQTVLVRLALAGCWPKKPSPRPTCRGPFAVLTSVTALSIVSRCFNSRHKASCCRHLPLSLSDHHVRKEATILQNQNLVPFFFSLFSPSGTSLKKHSRFNNKRFTSRLFFSLSRLPAIPSSSGRLHSEFVRLLFLQAHRETDRFFFNFRSFVIGIRSWILPLPTHDFL
jgi:hypothetical protein